MSESWEPIETAPKDSSYLLVCAVTDRHGRKNPPEWFRGLCAVVAWDDDAGWVAYLLEEGELHFNPTHWRHLPDPPDDGQLSERPVHAGLYAAGEGGLAIPICDNTGTDHRLVDVRDRNSISCRACRYLLGLDRPRS